MFQIFFFCTYIFLGSRSVILSKTGLGALNNQDFPRAAKVNLAWHTMTNNPPPKKKHGIWIAVKNSTAE